MLACALRLFQGAPQFLHPALQLLVGGPQLRHFLPKTGIFFNLRPQTRRSLMRSSTLLKQTQNAKKMLIDSEWWTCLRLTRQFLTCWAGSQRGSHVEKQPRTRQKHWGSASL